MRWLGCCLRCWRWKGFGVYFPHIPASAASLGAAQHSCPACLSVPGAGTGAGTGCERVHGVVALAQVAEREGQG